MQTKALGDDGTKGGAAYQSKTAARNAGLFKYGANDVYIGVDSTNWIPDGQGRPSLRLQSINDYTKGLFIARFTHMPKSTCGAWPAL